ncbi:pyruvate kinase [Candidatus Uhrbacteria bacterium]|nr:pyruvate kinase [Candidatus Uhrbacteria bacterium]
MPAKRTKIFCTIGPASDSIETLTALTEAGMNVCRLNFSHGTHENHAELIKRIRQVRDVTGEPLSILQDLQGPKIRVGEMPEEGVELVAGKPIVFTSDKGDIPKRIPVTYPNLHEDVKPGQRLLLDDGLLEVLVKSVKGKDVTCEVITGGKLKSHKGLNLPETETKISAITDKDKEDLVFGVAQGVDWIALSFVRSGEDIRQLRALIQAEEKKLAKPREVPIGIIAKIEKPQAVEKMDEIIAEVDAIMVARGDLGIEMPAEKVPVIQKDLIKKCLALSKPVIVATQMLDSMIRNPRATRAEFSDIATAVIDHADATMLSGETASGDHPLEAVKTMAATIIETEKSSYDDLPVQTRLKNTDDEAITNVASILSKMTDTKAILVAAMNGGAARLVSHFRPEVPICAALPSEEVAHQLNLSWGVRPMYLEGAKTIPELIEKGLEELKRQKLVSAGDEIVIVAGDQLGDSGHVQLVELKKV